MAIDTKKLIAKKLFETLEHKSIDQITVKYLVESCHISRQTFYYHFQDIPDVLKWGIQQALERDLETCAEAATTREAVSMIVSQVMKRKDSIRLPLGSKRQTELEQLLIRSFRFYLLALFRRLGPDPQMPAADLAAMVDFYAFGIIGLVLQRCEQDHADEAVLTDQLCRLLTGELHLPV